jgi:hypothetical protein
VQRCTIAAAGRRATRRRGRCGRRRAGIALASSDGVSRRPVAALAVLLAAAPVPAAVVPVAAVGDASPFAQPLSVLSDPVVTDAGRVAFLGASTAVFRRDGDRIVHVLGAGDALAGRTVADVGPPDQATGGCIATRVVFVGGGAAVVRRCGAVDDLVAGTGDAVPGGGTLASLGAEVRLGATGRVAFTGILADGTAVALFSDGAAPFTEIGRVGGPSPAGGTFSGFRLLGVSGSGRVGLRATVNGGRDGLFYWNGTQTVKLVVEGDATPSGGSFGNINLGTLNDADRWVFRATRTGDGLAGLFTADASPGRPLPLLDTLVVQRAATPLGGTYQSLPTSMVPVINAAGAVAFRATLADAGPSAAVFVASADGTVTPVVGVGQPTAAGELFRLRELSLADDGGVLVRATLSGGQPGLFLGRDGRLDAFAMLSGSTDLGGGFRFSDPNARATPEGAVFLGQREALLTAAGGAIAPVVKLGDPTPLGGTWAELDPPVATRGDRIVFGASVQGGRAGEALFAERAGRLRTLTRTGIRVKKGIRLLDIFGNPLDGVLRAGAGPGGVAFEATLGGGPGSGLLLVGGGRSRVRVAAGRPAPRGGRFAGFGTPAVPGRGRLAFVAEVGARREVQLVFLGGSRGRTLATVGVESGTRLAGLVRGFGVPTAAARGVVVRTTVGGSSGDGLLFAGSRTPLVALLAGGDAAPGGGRFRGFSDPAPAGDGVVVRAGVVGGTSAGGLFQVTIGRRPVDDPAPVAPLARLGDPGPLGGTYLGFGVPAGNASGTVAVAADLAGASASTAIVTVVP